MCQLFEIRSRRKLKGTILFLVVSDKKPDLSPKFQPLSVVVMLYLHSQENKISLKLTLPGFTGVLLPQLFLRRSLSLLSLGFYFSRYLRRSFPLLSLGFYFISYFIPHSR